MMNGALESFFDTGRLAGAGERALVMTTSEFGRRVASNGSGNDHGIAAPHLFVGDGVRGGRYGEAPDLSALDGRGNMIHTVDYRSVYASVLEGWLGTRQMRSSERTTSGSACSSLR